MMVWSSCNSGPELVDRLERGGGLGFDGGREVEVGRGRDGGLRSTAGHGLANSTAPVGASEWVTWQLGAT